MDRIGQVLIGAPPRDRGLQVPRDLQLVRSFCLVKFEVGPIKAVEPRKEVAQPVDPASDSRGIEAQRSLRRQEDAEKPAQCRRPEERRGGKEWVITCRYRWSPDH